MGMGQLPENLPHNWRQRAEQLRDWGGSAEVVRLWERAASELEQALQVAGSETLSLTEAARVSGLSAGYLGDLVRAGKLSNAGRKHAPRIRRADLPVTNEKPAHPRPRPRSRLKITEIATKLR